MACIGTIAHTHAHTHTMVAAVLGPPKMDWQKEEESPQPLFWQGCLRFAASPYLRFDASPLYTLPRILAITPHDVSLSRLGYAMWGVVMTKLKN